jgi:hypothetical protein
MFNQAYSNVVRTFVCTVGAVAVSSVFLFAAAGPVRAATIDTAAEVKIIDAVSGRTPIAY